jgi:uncharacterized protein with PIN domain
MGFDTLSEREYPLGGFLQRIGPDRIFLTRTQRLAGERHGLKTIFIQANDPADQVVELIRILAIQPEEIQPFSRCISCNEPIMAVAKDAVRKSVPEYVWSTQVNFSNCPKCGRVFWKGTHTERGLKRIMEFFNAPSAV